MITLPPSQPATDIVFITKTVVVHTLVWAVNVQKTLWTCGPLTVKRFIRDDSGEWSWGLFLGKRRICRRYGYTTSTDAKASAGSHLAVRELIRAKELQKG